MTPLNWTAIASNVPWTIIYGSLALIEGVEGHSGGKNPDFANSHDVGCIVMASHRPGLQDYLLGSTAARVLRHANCSVYIVR